MKKIFLLLMLVPVFCFAQKIVKHTVVASESFTSIAKKYNVNGRAIATFNNLNYEKGLTIGQELKIQLPKAATKVPILKEPVPVKDTKVVKEKPLPIKEKVKTEPSKTGAATKHLVGAKETLYGISKIYGITVADIKKWNNLTSDNLEKGMELTVGYGNIIKKPYIKEDDTPAAEEPVTKIEPKKVKPAKPAAKPTDDNPIKEINNTNQDGGDGRGFKGGFFKSLYRDNGKSVEGTAGVFKSTSGWEDGKYYCLHNTAKQGTIIKVSNVVNGRSIYAKVLDIMPDLKQNQNLIIRISNAAADALGETIATNIIVTLSY